MRQKRHRAKTPTDAPPPAEAPAYRHGTLGWLAASVAFKDGYDAAVAVLRDYLPGATFQDWSIVHDAQGFSTLRTEVTAASDITYLSFDPPELWGSSYSVLKATFAPRRQRTEFMSHAGEEVLVPTAGRIQYHFAWTPGGQLPEVRLTPALERGTAIRLASQVPHHTWAAGAGEAAAWMVFRPISESPTAINVRARQEGKKGVGRSGYTRNQVLNPVTYALLAWGIAEQTRLFRDRANIGVSALAALCHVDPAQISRIEAASQNVSIEAIARLARFLRLPLPQLVAQAAQEWMVEAVPVGEEQTTPERPTWTPILVPRSDLQHHLHLGILRLGGLWAGPVPSPRALPPGKIVTWIVLEGALEIQLREARASATVLRAELMQKGSVAHFRHVMPTHLAARAPCSVLQITASGECTCGGPAA